MKKQYLFPTLMAGLLLAAGVSWGQAPEVLRASQSLSGASSTAAGTGVATEPTTGDMVVAGYFSGKTILGDQLFSSAGNNDLFVARYDLTGKLRWAVKAGGASDDQSRGLALDAEGNTVITGTLYNSATANDIAIVKIDTNGAALWSVQEDGFSGEDGGSAVAVDDTGDVYVSGYEFAGATSGFFNLFVAKYSGLNGSQIWKKNEGGASGDRGLGIVVSGEKVAVTGYHNAGATIASIALPNSGVKDVFLAVYTTDGTPAWATSAGGAGDDIGNAVTMDASGNIYVTGSFSGIAAFGSVQLESSGDTDIFVAGYNGSGDLLFASRAGGSGADAGYGITLDDSGDILITGKFSGTATFGSQTIESAGGTDGFVAQFDGSGNCLWALGGGGTGTDIGSAVSTGGGRIYTTGSFQGISAFGNLTLATHATNDLFYTVMGDHSMLKDVNLDGRLGLDDAIGILQILTGLYP